MTDSIRRPDEEWEESQQPLFDAYYHRLFDKLGLVRVDRFHDAERQVQGMDLALVFKSKRLFTTVDEKSRKPARAYADIAIELRHEYDDGSVRPGWISYSKCDYFLYHWGWSGTLFWLPREPLQSALQRLWDENEKQWPTWCTLIPSRRNNRGYTTINLGVPAERLMTLLQGSGRLAQRRDNINAAPQQVKLLTAHC